MGRRRMVGLWLSFLVSSRSVAAEAPHRIVSANLCADRLVLALADPDHIVSLSYHSGDPSLSTIAAQASHMPLNHGDAEEIAALHPDLVIFGSYTSTASATLLKGLGFSTYTLAVPTDLAEMRKNIRGLAARLGVPERGEAMISDIDRKLADIVKPHRPVRAIIYSAGGWTHGAGSIDDDVLRLVGASNIATGAGIQGIGTLDLEQLVAADPQLIIVENTGNGQKSLAAQLLDHPVLQSPTIHHLEMPMTLWECIDGSITDAVQKIEDALP